MTRQTGKTTAMMREAEQAALSGKQVVVVVHERSFADHCVRLLGDLNGWQYWSSIATLRHESGGRIRFMAATDVEYRLRGLRCHVFVDHFAGERLSVQAFEIIEYTRQLAA